MHFTAVKAALITVLFLCSNWRSPSDREGERAATLSSGAMKSYLLLLLFQVQYY